MTALAGRLAKLSGARRAAAAFLCGALGAAAMPPYDVVVAMAVSFPVLVWLIDGTAAAQTSRRRWLLLPAFLTGWWFGFGYFVAGLWWLGNALLVDAEAFAWALPLAVLGLPAVLAVFHGLAAAFARMLWSDGAGRIAALAAGFGLAEWLRGFLFTGFPWNAVGYAMMPAPVMMQSVGIVGLEAMSALAVFVFAAPALAPALTPAPVARRRGAVAGLAAAALLLGAHIGYGTWLLANTPPAHGSGEGPVFRLVQPVTDQSVRWRPEEAARIFETHLAMSAAAPVPATGRRPDIIIWPETAVPFILSDNPRALQRIAEVLEDGQRLLTGAVRRQPAEAGALPRYYNAILVIDGNGRIVDVADKNHLVPFGEYLPFENWLRSLGLAAVAEMPGGYSAGRMRLPLDIGRGLTAWPLICYEAIFPAAMPPAGGARPDLLLNLTNDAWFGDTPGPYQHFRQAQIRAVQAGLPMIRVANTGVSAAIDARGRILNTLGLYEQGFIDTTLTFKYPAKVPFIPQGIYFWLSFAMLSCVAAFSRRSLE